ncbi:MAG: aldo/keto reductase [Planctomycetota bacterium]
MRTVTLGKTGLEVSAVGFGGIPIQRVSEAEAVATIHRTIELGVNFIDTAAGYGDSEAKIGKAIAGRRDGLVIATKSGEATAEGVLEEIEQSRRAMGIDVIDLFQFHGVNNREKWEKIQGPGGAMEAVLALRDKGVLAHVGVTSHSLDLSLELVDFPEFETIQFPFNLVTNEPADELIPRARANGLGFIVMKPLCGGQYENANLAFKFLNAWSDVVPIPGIERAEEIEEIAEIVASGETLQGEEKARAEQIAADLGKLFCRRCGYCMPCPHDVPIMLSMIFDSFLKRFPEEKLLNGPVKAVLENNGNCVECGICETKCPYDLPIREKVAESLDRAACVAEQA